MDAGACGVMVAPLTGLTTEAQIVTYFADVIAALGEKTPVVYQDYPQSTQADISAQSFLKIVDAHPSVVMFKDEDCPGLKKLTQIRKACDGVTRRYISILVGNGGLYVPQELARGADGIMTGFAYPEMLVSVSVLFAAGRSDEAVCICRSCATSSSRVLGLPCARKFCAGAAPFGRRQCAPPGPKLDGLDVAELDRLLSRLEARLRESANGRRLAVA
jgi:4-hydroxy-tetrahydrodipicolinate synthase